MSELVLALSRRALATIFSGEAESGGIRKWIEVGSFYFEQATQDSFTLRIASLEEFGRYQLYDYRRFAFSSLESMSLCSRNPGRAKALAWPMLQSYYAGFFGAHAMMRAMGQGIMRVELKQAQIITARAQLSDESFILKGGTFKYAVSQLDDGAIEIAFSRIADGSGVHDSFWIEYVAFLRNIAKQISLNNETDALVVVGRFAEVERVLCAKGSLSGGWLSMIRNKLNYQHDFGVWFPYDISNRQAEFAQTLGFKQESQWRLDFNATTEILELFSSAALQIASVNVELANLFLGVSSGRRTQVSKSWQRLAAECELNLRL